MPYDTFPDVSVDADGYPTDELIAWLKAEPDGVLALKEAAAYCNSCGFGNAEVKDGMLRIATGGWSGCQDVISAIGENLHAMQRWESHHRGGLWVFDVEGVDGF